MRYISVYKLLVFILHYTYFWKVVHSPFLLKLMYYLYIKKEFSDLVLPLPYKKGGKFSAISLHYYCNNKLRPFTGFNPPTLSNLKYGNYFSAILLQLGHFYCNKERNI